MIWKEIGRADAVVAACAVEEADQAQMHTFVADPEVMAAVVDVAEALAGEVRLGKIATCVGELAAGAEWSEIDGFKPGGFDTDRKKTLYVVSALALFCTKPDAEHKPMHDFNRCLGKLKDDPDNMGYARWMESVLIENPTAEDIFGKSHELAPVLLVKQRIHRSIDALYPVLEQDRLSEKKYHNIRKQVRRLALVNVLAQQAVPNTPISRDAVLLRALHKRMGSERLQTDRAGQVTPSSEVKDLALELLTA